MKDNDKLLHGFAAFMRQTRVRARLVLFEKGRPQDIENSKQLIQELHISEYVDWWPELPNKVLRVFYCLPQVVVCDQYNPHLAGLGNIGREASYWGCPLVTAFNADWNRPLYGSDMPPHVMGAQTAEEIALALQRLALMDAQERTQAATAGKAWFRRQLHAETLIPRLINVINTARAIA
jgi:hypothetical protein